MPVKSYKLLVHKLLHGPHLQPEGLFVPQPCSGALLAHLNLLRELQNRAKVQSSFSLERAVTRMQLRVERLSSMYWEGRMRARAARQKLEGLMQAERRASGQYASSSGQPSAVTPPASDHALRQAAPATAAAAADARSLVSTEDAMMGHDGLLRQVLLKSVASMSNTFMHSWNTTEVTGSEYMEAALKRPKDQGLVTVCNHVAAMDDPLVMASLVPPEYYSQPKSLRWTLCATDRCFKYAGLSQLFTAMKVLPVERGAGMRQPGLAAAEARVAAGDWVHLFPEGTRSRTPSKMGPLRKGVGRLVAAATEQAEQQGGKPPLVLPFVHAGMEEVLPRGRVLPCTGQTVRVIVGKPIGVEDLLRAAKQNEWTEDALYKAISQRIERRMHAMHATLHAREAEVITDDVEEAATATAGPAYGAPHTPAPLSFPPSFFSDLPLSWEGVSRSRTLAAGAQPVSLLGCSVLAEAGLLGEQWGAGAGAAEGPGSLCENYSGSKELSEGLMEAADSSSSSSGREAVGQGFDGSSSSSSSSSHRSDWPGSALGLCEGLLYGYGLPATARAARL